MSKTTNKYSPEVRQRAVRLVLDHEHEHPSRRAAILSISSKIGCTGQTLNEWVKKVEVDAGKRAGVPTDMAAKLRALERENRELRQANEILYQRRRVVTRRWFPSVSGCDSRLAKEKRHAAIEDRASGRL